MVDSLSALSRCLQLLQRWVCVWMSVEVCVCVEVGVDVGVEAHEGETGSNFTIPTVAPSISEPRQCC